MKDFLMIGEILKPQGVKGEAKVKPYASCPDDFIHWNTLFLKEKDTYAPVEAHCSRVHDGFAYITIAGCTSPDDVEKLRGRQLYVKRSDAFPLDDDSVYIADLIGISIVSTSGTEIGILTDVLQYGSVDTYVFKTSKGTVMAPALKSVFTDIDLNSNTMTVNLDKLREVAVVED